MADPTPQPELKEELARAIKEMETRAGSFSEAEVFDKVRDVLSNKQVSRRRTSLYTKAKAMPSYFRPRRKEEAPFPGYFQPMMWFPKSDGST